MTCKDCIYYHSIGTLCDKYIYPEERRNETCEDFQISSDYGCDITRFDAYCKDYDNTLKQIWESVSK